MNNIIIKRLASKAIERSVQKEEFGAFCIEQTETAIQNWENDKPTEAILCIDRVIGFLPKLSFLWLLKSLFYCSAKQSNKSNKIIN